MIKKFPIFLLILLFTVTALSGCKQAVSPAEEAPSAPEQAVQPVLSMPSEETEAMQTIEKELQPSEEEADPSYDRLLAQKNQIFQPGDSALTPAEGLAVHDEARYTVMVYMTGSNLETMGAYATKDLLEMENAGLSFDDINLLVYTGGAQSWKSWVPSAYNCISDMSLDPEDRMIASTEGNADMGAPETLASFLNFSTLYYPAEHYALIFWDHGGGPLWGYGSDELFNGDSLLMTEMRSAMDYTRFRSGARLDFVGFDACLMGSCEMASLWSSYASYYVASEELEPGNGWDYSFLSILNETSDPEEICGRILSSYQDSYDALRTETYDPQITLSCINLSRIQALYKAMDRLFLRADQGLRRGDYHSVQQCRYQSKSFGNVETRTGESYAYDLVDLRDLTQQFSSLYPQEAQKVLDALDRAIVSQVANTEGAHGLSLYYPCNNKGQYEKLSQTYRTLSDAPSYLDFLKSMTSVWSSSKSRDWSIGDLIYADDSWTYQLSEEQQDHLAAATYSVFLSGGEGSYTPVLQNMQLRPDRDGLLRIPADPTAVYMRTGAEEDQIWPVVQLEKNSQRETYRTSNTRLASDPNLFMHIMDVQTLPVTAVMTADVKTGSLTLRSITETSAVDALGGKNTVDYTGWEAVYYYMRSTTPLRDANGNLLPYAQWYQDPSASSYTIAAFDGDLSFYQAPLSDSEAEYVIQLVLEDTSGETYASELTPVSAHTWRLHEQHTPQGLLRYRLYEGHAAIDQYIGSDESLTIPDTVEGLPVIGIRDTAFSPTVIGSSHTVPQLTAVHLPSTLTDIGRYAFYGCSHLKEIAIPEGVTRLGTGAFAGCQALETVSLPESLTAIGKACFDGCSALKEITLPPRLSMVGKGLFMGCSSLQAIHGDALAGYRLVNDALYSEDGLQLLAYPAALTGSLRVPDGTETIAYSALYETSLSELILPESLRRIEGQAVFGCQNLAVPLFPEGLEKIGHEAFGAGDLQLSYLQIPEEASVIPIGPHVDSVASDAFDIFPAKRFTVDPENPYFSECEGHLANKAGDTLVILATNRRQTCRIPDGVTSFDWDLLSFIRCYDLFETRPDIHVSFPESVQKFYDTPASAYRLILHAPPGSCAMEYAVDHGISRVTDTDLEYRIHTEQDAAGTCYYRLYQDHAMLLVYIGTGGRLTVPDQVAGLPVTVIGDGKNPVEFSSFASYQDVPVSSDAETESLLELVLPDSVRIISGSAFSGSYMLQKVSLPDDLQVIGDQAFSSYRGEQLTTLPAHLTYIGADSGRLFRQIPVSAETSYISPQVCRADGPACTFVQISDNKDYAVVDGLLCSADGKTLLKWPSSLTEDEIRIPEGIESIGPYAFHGTAAVSVVFPSTLHSIEAYAFASASRMESYDLPEGLISIGDHAFTSNTKLSAVTLPASVREIESYGFYACRNLTQLTLNEGLTYIGDSAFYDTPITSLSLPASLVTIGDNAFGSYSDTARAAEPFTLSIGPSLSSIGTKAFANLPIAAFEVHPDNPFFCSDDGLLYDKTGQVLYLCPTHGASEIHVADRTVMIMGYCFSGCYNVTDVYLGAGVTRISMLAIPDNYWVTEETGRRYVDAYWITLHCPKGSYAESFAVAYDVPYQIQ